MDEEKTKINHLGRKSWSLPSFQTRATPQTQNPLTEETAKPSSGWILQPQSRCQSFLKGSMSINLGNRGREYPEIARVFGHKVEIDTDTQRHKSTPLEKTYGVGNKWNPRAGLFHSGSTGQYLWSNV